jgi:hypothetical protein
MVIPKIRVSAVAHYANRLERLCVSGPVVGHGPINALVNETGMKIGLKLRINTLGMARIKPRV